MGWILDHVPFWVYALVTALSCGAVFYFFSPILIPIWNLTPKWVKASGAAIAGIFGAYLAGRYRGAQNERDREKQANAEAIQNRQKINENIARTPDADVDKQLSRWMRD